MAKCKYCNGTGIIIILRGGEEVYETCNCCKGTGVMVKPKKRRKNEKISSILSGNKS